MLNIDTQHLLQMAREHHEAGRLAQAEPIYRQILQVQPDNADALDLLGFLALQAGHIEPALALIRQAIAIDGAEGLYQLHLGQVLTRIHGREEEAVAAFRRAIALGARSGEVYINLGITLYGMRRFDEAVEFLQQAVALMPHESRAHANLGVALTEAERVDEAIAACNKAVELAPHDADAHYNLANAFRKKGQLSDAILSYERTLALKPGMLQAQVNLATTCRDAGGMDDAVRGFRAAMASNPESAVAHSSLLFTLHFHPASTPASLLEESRAWARKHADPLKKFMQPHSNDRNPDRPLRIGYVSPDFRVHPVGRFLLTLFANHNHEDFQIVAYSTSRQADEVTRRLRSGTDLWRDVMHTTDEQLAEMIRQDRIDILVDLSCHMALNRLRVFARKPAPVQVSWLGFPGTTGLDTIDYRITDALMDPPCNDAFYSEQCFRLPQVTSCYEPGLATPEINTLPALGTGRITFACLNNFCKVTPGTVDAWVRIMRAAPQSDLLLFAGEGEHQEGMRDRLRRENIDPARVSFVGFGGAKYFDFYHRIDIVLDPFPYTGSTTTCDALWMGVPVVTLAGQAIFTRMSMGALMNVELPDLITYSVAEYERKAVELANDVPRLIELRATLRQRLQRSPLTNAPRFARDMEAAYRTMWRRWCAEGS